MKPIIKFNGGNPVGICNRCFITMCRVFAKDEIPTVSVRLGNAERDYISTPIGSPVPCYCDDCSELLNYTLNE